METIKYSGDGLSFTLLGPTGSPTTDEAAVPETGVAYLSTRVGPRVVTFPVYTLPGVKPPLNTVFELRPVVTKIQGTCASASDIEESMLDDDEDEDGDEVEELDDDIDDEDDED